MKIKLLILTTILLISIASAIEPTSLKVQVLIHNNTIQIKGDNIIDFSDAFLVDYIYSINNCTANMTTAPSMNSLNASINYNKNIELVFVNKNFNESELGCYNELSKSYERWTQCYSDNMNISVANAICQQDTGYKDKFTACQTDLTSKNVQLSGKDAEIANKQKEVDDAKSGSWQKYGLGAIAGIIACYFYLRREGKTAPVRFGEEIPQAPSNAT